MVGLSGPPGVSGFAGDPTSLARESMLKHGVTLSYMPAFWERSALHMVLGPSDTGGGLEGTVRC